MIVPVATSSTSTELLFYVVVGSVENIKSLQTDAQMSECTLESTAVAVQPRVALTGQRREAIAKSHFSSRLSRKNTS